MASAEIKEILNVDKDRFFEVVTRYEDYPLFVDGCTSVKVERPAPGRARVTYHVSMMKDVTYTLDLTENAEKGTIDWKLVESDFFKVNNGSWRIKSAGAGKTEVHYGLEVEFKIPVPGLILNRLVKGNLPSMVKSFEKRVREKYGHG
ncbi:MAG: SRPBCC family protein [Oligoflexia bacterium]|nr:SRPBCC family protein [Oligoflexia bacterium]